jgi:hypothetical protein
VTHSFARHKGNSQHASDSRKEILSNFVTVSEDESALSIRASEDVLEGIRRIAVEQFLSIPRGGLEAGGLLFGNASDNGLTILGFEELPIQHLLGPSFLLSPQDEEALTLKLREHNNGEELTVIGWWHSHTRSDVGITEDDLKIHHKFFAGDKQIALIVKPFKLDPAIAAVYLPNRPEPESLTACCRFTIGKARNLIEIPEVAEPREVAVLTPMVVNPPSRANAAKRSRRPVFAALTAAALVLVGVGAAFYSSTPKPQPVPIEPMNLRLSGSGPELTVHWDRNSRALTDIATAELVIIDGSDAMKIPLSAENLLAGTLSYVRRTGKVDITLRTRTRTNELYEAVAHYVGPAPVTPVVAESKPDSAEVERMRAEMERLNSELERMRSASPKAPEVNAKSRTPELLPVKTIAPSAPTRATQPVASVPTLPVPSLSLATQTPAGPAAPEIHTPSLPAPKSAPTPIPATRVTSGRAIWTGALPRGGVLLFDGHRPSAGAVTGRLPQRPSRVRVFSADLTDSGIVVYTGGGNEHIEPPSAANGWNLTMYRPDVKRSRDLTVVEPPGPGNGWQRIIIRSEQRTVSMLVLEWDELSAP